MDRLDNLTARVSCRMRQTMALIDTLEHVILSEERYQGIADLLTVQRELIEATFNEMDALLTELARV